jgi:hypothetical protein
MDDEEQEGLSKYSRIGRWSSGRPRSPAISRLENQSLGVQKLGILTPPMSTERYRSFISDTQKLSYSSLCHGRSTDSRGLVFHGLARMGGREMRVDCTKYLRTVVNQRAIRCESKLYTCEELSVVVVIAEVIGLGVQAGTLLSTAIRDPRYPTRHDFRSVVPKGLSSRNKLF